MNLTKIFGLAVIAASFLGTQYYLSAVSHNAPKRPEVVEAVKRSLRAELAQSSGLLPDGKVMSWGVPGSSMRLMGTATVVDHDASGCYDLDVQTNLRTPYRSDATYKVCP